MSDLPNGSYHYYAIGHSKPILCEIERGFVYTAHLEYAMPVKAFKGKFVRLYELETLQLGDAGAKEAGA